jgi:salicylate hydroxylase
MATSTKLTVAIAGAGVAGLAAAVGLKDHPNIEFQIYEKAQQLEEIGASIALGPNGMRTLERLGVENALDESIAFRNQSGFPMIYRYMNGVSNGVTTPC